jgi:hypothetical protein
MTDWVGKSKGFSGVVYVHPNFERAIVFYKAGENQGRYSYNGFFFDTLDEAKLEADKETTND